MKIFLVVPFSSRVAEGGEVEPSYRKTIEGLIAQLRAHGRSVFCALEYADWRIGGLTTPEAELGHDLAEIDSSDLLVVLLEERISAGIQLECGYAYAKGKDIAAYQIGKPAWSNAAFSN